MNRHGKRKRRKADAKARKQGSTKDSTHSTIPTKLRKLGKVLHVSKRGSLILRTEKTPPVGPDAVVMNKKAEEIGFILDVFGPVKSPYVSVRLKTKSDMDEHVGQTLYFFKK